MSKKRIDVAIDRRLTLPRITMLLRYYLNRDSVVEHRTVIVINRKVVSWLCVHEFLESHILHMLSANGVKVFLYHTITDKGIQAIESSVYQIKKQ